MNPDPTLGIEIPNFDADGFRAAILFAQQMGTTPDPDKRPKFIKKSRSRTYWKNDVELTQPRLGRDGSPLDPEIETRVAEPEVPVEADCTVEIFPVEEGELPAGNFRPTKAVVTLLDREYAKINDCREMTYNGDRYLYGYDPDVVGLFEVGVHTIVFYALDES